MADYSDIKKDKISVIVIKRIYLGTTILSETSEHKLKYHMASFT